MAKETGLAEEVEERWSDMRSDVLVYSSSIMVCIYFDGLDNLLVAIVWNFDIYWYFIYVSHLLWYV